MISYLIFILGLLIGSFLNVCIYRLPQNASILIPPSHCMSCSKRLKPWDLIPVISYLLTRGHCRYCKANFSARYALVELLTGLLFMWCFQVFGYCDILVKALILVSFFIIITFIDYDHQLILDKVLLWLAGTGVIINLWTGSVGIVDMLIAGVIGGGLLLIIALVSGGGMGGGDIKFAAVLGLCFGWQSLLLILLLSFVFGGIGGGLLLITKLKNRKDFIPFGPFIALAAVVTLLYGNNLISWYLSKY